MKRISHGLKAIHSLFIWTLAALIFISPNALIFAAEEIPQSFTYQGRFMNAAGTAAIADGAP